MPDFPHPLQLATGSHQAGSGKGCAMNVISWENGDTTITDLPACSDPMLSRIVQNVNDHACDHRDGELLCPPCSLAVLALAHRTVGTGGSNIGGTVTLDRRRVWVRVAADQARQVLHLADIRGRGAALAAIEAAEAWADEPTREHAAAAREAADAAVAARTASYLASSPVSAAADAAYAAADAAVAYVTVIAAARAGYASGDRLRLAHRAIDLFYELTGLTEQQPDPQHTARAVAAMTTTV